MPDFGTSTPISPARRSTRAQMREEAAQQCDNYGREGDRLAKEYACELADELAARIRALPDEPQEKPE